MLVCTLKEIQTYTDRPNTCVCILRQDRQMEVPKDFDVEISKNTDGAGLLEGGAGLQRDFDDAWCVVGFNSNALTESAMEGIPTFSMCPKLYGI